MIALIPIFSVLGWVLLGMFGARIGYKAFDPPKNDLGFYLTLCIIMAPLTVLAAATIRACKAVNAHTNGNIVKSIVMGRKAVYLESLEPPRRRSYPPGY